MFYWAVNGSPTWNAETVLPALSAVGPPSITIAGNYVYIGYTAFFGPPAIAWAVNGSSTWYSESLPGQSLSTLGEGVAANGNTVDAAYNDAHNDLIFAWAVDGSSTWNVGRLLLGPQRHPDVVRRGHLGRCRPAFAMMAGALAVPRRTWA
jgi:hypothetical protein